MHTSRSCDTTAITRILLVLVSALAALSLFMLTPATAAFANDPPETTSEEGAPADGDAPAEEAAGDEAPAADEMEWGFIPRVVGEENAGIPGATVTVYDEGGEEVGTAITGDNGSTPPIPVDAAGTYTVVVDTSDIEQSFVDGDVYGISSELGAANTLPVQRVLVSLSETANGGEVAVDAEAGSSSSSSSITMTQFLRQLIYGINLGLILALAVLGMTLIMGTTGLTNFAYGDSLTIGALVAFFASIVLQLPIWVAALFAVAAGALAHFILDVVVWRPARRRKVAIVPLMIATIGVGFIIRYLGYAFFGGASKRVTSESIPSVNIGNVVFPASVYYTVGVAVVTILLVMWWLRKSRSGRAIRAVAANRPLAAATGVNIDKTIRLVWILSGALAGIAGVLMAFLNDVAWDMGFKALLLIFAAMVLGGVGSTRGAVVGALIVGILTEVLVLWMPSDMKLVGGLGVLILVLLVRPQGIFGRAERVG